MVHLVIVTLIIIIMNGKRKVEGARYSFGIVINENDQIHVCWGNVEERC